MGSYYYDFSELVSEMEQLNSEADRIYSRQGELLTEIKGLREDMQKYDEHQTSALTVLTVLVVALAAIKVIFK